MTCYTNCIHCDVCKCADGVEYKDCEDMKADCTHFKNKADFVEVKHGYWKPTNIPAYFFGGVIYECSLCGVKDGDHTKILGKYCWRCGAKMDGERKRSN